MEIADTFLFLVLGCEGPYFVQEHSDLKNKHTEDDKINMLEFLVDNLFMVFGRKVFQQIVGISMGTNCAPLLAGVTTNNDPRRIMTGGHYST